MTTDITTPLDEELDAPEISESQLRGLVISGGRPYILITVTNEEGGVELDSVGVEPDAISRALREIADLVDADLGDE